MPNEDEEPKIANLPGYQFFSTDLNYNYFGDQSASTPEVLATSAGSSALDLLTTSAGSSALDLLATSSGSSSLDLLTTSAGSSSPNLLTTSIGSSAPNLLTTSAGSSAPNLLTTSADSLAPNSVGTSTGPSTPNSVKTSAVSSAQNAPVVENPPVRVAYSLTEDGPEPTFEERVAAMEREIAAADAASAAARAAAAVAAARPATAPNSEISSASIFAPAVSAASAPVPALHTTPVIAPVTAPGYVSQQATTPVQSEPKWNQYVEPSVVPDVFSSAFNFNRSLLKIFWRIDIDHNNRVSKNELAIALQENWFEGDERVLAKLLYESYEDISPETIFCDAGLSVNNILSFGPFAEMAASQLESQIPEPVRPEKSARPAQKKSNNKSAQSLRSLFKR